MTVLFPAYEHFDVGRSALKVAMGDYDYYNGSDTTERHQESCRSDATFCNTQTISTGATFVIQFEFRPHATAAERTSGMQFADPALAGKELGTPVPVGHLHLHVLDLTGVQINGAGVRTEHVHSALLVRTAEGRFVLEARHRSKLVVCRTVYDTDQLAQLLAVPPHGMLFCSLQNVSNLEICNATASIVAVLLMHNWQGDVGVLRELMDSLNSVTRKQAKQLFVWLLWDAFTPPADEPRGQKRGRSVLEPGADEVHA
jgi:hypothetical protein